jgi:disulfide oxidoreductase YuzD
VVKDKYDKNKKYQKNYGLTIEKDHFIMPLITTDEDTINAALQETIYDIFQDDGLIENLKS